MFYNLSFGTDCVELKSVQAFSCVIKDSPLGARFSTPSIMACICTAGFCISLLYCTDAGITRGRCTH